MPPKLMATSSSDAATRPHTGLLRLLHRPAHSKVPASISNAMIPIPAASIQQEWRHIGLTQSRPPPHLSSYLARFKHFPASRYTDLRAYESPMHSRALQRQHSVMATDTASKKQVLLSSFAKAVVTEW